MVMDDFWRFEVDHCTDAGQVEVGAHLVKNYKELGTLLVTNISHLFVSGNAMCTSK